MKKHEREHLEYLAESFVEKYWVKHEGISVNDAVRACVEFAIAHHKDIEKVVPVQDQQPEQTAQVGTDNDRV